MKIIEKAENIMKHYVCDNCLGRQFGQLLSGYDNAHRGRAIRTIVAMSIDREDLKPEEWRMDMLNFTGFRFHSLEINLEKLKEGIKSRKCYVCGNVFSKLGKYIDLMQKAVKNIEFNTFLVGTKLSSDLVEKEEHLWENVGIDYCEPVKAELNREIGKLVERSTGKKFSVKNPDIVIVLSMEKPLIDIQINPLFIYGEYQKLVRGIPQTKWPNQKYRTSVEQIIAKPYMKFLRAKGHKLHGYGREDIDARCLAWRPFVLEILEPRKRVDKGLLQKLSKKISRHVRVRSIRFSDIGEVRKIKEAKGDKTYRTLVHCEKPVSKDDLKKLSVLATEIRQRTPERVLHRRANLLRKRSVLSIKARQITSKAFELIVKAEGGLYVKELISGDNGRTVPSVSSVLDNACKCKELDVIGMRMIKK